MQSHIDFFTTEVQLDTCEIFADDDSSSAGSDDSGVLPFVTAGPVVVINSPSGTWFTVPQAGNGIYEVDDQLPGALPIGATLSIPGDEFPSVGAIPLETPSAPVRVSPTNGVLTGDEDYIWVAERGAGVSITIDISEFDDSGNFQRFFAACNVRDGGLFVMPADVLSAMAVASPDSVFIARYSRTIRSLGLVEGVAVFSRIIVAE